MDKSKEYIEMCKCPEIQDNAPKPDEFGHFFFTNGMFHCGLYPNPELAKLHKEQVWLPRQDQLQEMTQLTTWYLELYFHHWFLKNSEINTEKTMEQLWLMYVMWFKHKLSWNGKNWIKS